jgi:hypothetical protein
LAAADEAIAGVTAKSEVGMRHHISHLIAGLCCRDPSFVAGVVPAHLLLVLYYVSSHYWVSSLAANLVGGITIAAVQFTDKRFWIVGWIAGF